MKKKEVMLSPEEIKRLLDGTILWKDLKSQRKGDEPLRRRLEPPREAAVSNGKAVDNRQEEFGRPTKIRTEISTPPLVETDPLPREAKAPIDLTLGGEKADDFATKWDLLTSGTEKRKEFRQIEWGELKRERKRGQGSSEDREKEEMVVPARGLAPKPGEAESPPDKGPDEDPQPQFQGKKVYIALFSAGLLTLGTWIYYVFA